MTDSDLIAQRQYAETVLGGLNIRPFRVDLAAGLVYVPKTQTKVVRKLCKHFGWPLVVAPMPKR